MNSTPNGRSPRIQLIAVTCIGALLTACFHTDAPPVGESHAGTIPFTDLDGRARTAAPGQLSFTEDGAIWRTRVDGKVYVVTGQVYSESPLHGSLSVADQHGNELLAFELDGTLWSVRAGPHGTSHISWALDENNQSAPAGLTSAGRDQLSMLAPKPNVVGPLLLEAFWIILETTPGERVVDDGIGSTQRSIIGVLLALAALISAIAGLISAIDELTECPPTSASCADGRGSVTCTGCLNARCDVIQGAAGPECICTCF